MRAVDRTPRTPNHNAFTPAQRQLASKVSALRRAQAIESGQTDAAEALAPAVAEASWGPFGAYFVTRRSPHWAGIDHTYKTIWAQRRPVLTVRIWADGTHTVHEIFTPAEGEAYFQKARGKRREAAAQAAEKAARVRRILGRATPAQRAYMYAQAWGIPHAIHPLVAKHGAPPVGGWEFDGSFLVNEGEMLPAHNAIRTSMNDEEVAHVVCNLQRTEERAEREAARARAAGVARIGRAVAEAAWQAVCLAKEAEAEQAARNMRRIHA